MAAKPFIAARISEDLSLKLDDYSKTTGESRTQIILNALSAYIGYSPNKEVSESASDRLTRLEKKVTELESLLKEPKQISLLQDTPSENLTHLQLTTDNRLDNTEQHKPPKAKQGVISLDNTSDNKSDNETDNTDNKGLLASEKDLVEHPNPEYGIYIEQMKTNEIPKLPGLESQDAKKIKTKLSNTRNLKGPKVAKIGPYVAYLTILSKGEGKKNEYLWDVYQNNNAVLSADNES